MHSRYLRIQGRNIAEESESKDMSVIRREEGPGSGGRNGVCREGAQVTPMVIDQGNKAIYSEK